MKKLVVFSLVCCGALALSACAFPDVSHIDLSGCTDKCNADSRKCFDTANANVDACLAADAGETVQQKCIEVQTKAGEACVNTLVDCVSSCIEETQKQLGGK